MGEKKQTILIVEDHADIAELLDFHLSKEGFQTVIASDGQEAIKAVDVHRPSLVLLDLMLPKLNGIEVAKSIRARKETSRIPIIMLTAKGEEKDIVSGLEAGADDYSVKPIKAKELIARIHAVLRRSSSSPAFDSQKSIKVDDLVIDEERHQTLLDQQKIDLTLTEFQILLNLVKASGRIFTRDQLIDKVRGHNIAIIDRNIDVHISSLRRKLKDYGKRIVTVRGIGYRFADV